MDFLKKQKVRLLQIQPEDFHHAKTFNWAARQFNDDFIVRLSGDVVPTNDNFLTNLADQFKDPKVMATYGKYILPTNSKLVLPFAWPKKRFGKKSELIQIKPSFLLWREFINLKRFERIRNLAGGACAIRRSFYEGQQFNENLIEGEDAEYAVYIHHLGYKVGYNPKAVVYHEHEKKKRTYTNIKRFTLIHLTMMREFYKINLNQYFYRAKDNQIINPEIEY